jgi:hypothetical protein
MKTFYSLSENLDLRDENFIVKKGTLVSVVGESNSYKQSPSVLKLNFDNIDGNYHMAHSEFEDLVLANKLTKLTAKFDVGDCVSHKKYGKGIVESRRPDPFFGYSYNVKFDSGLLGILEQNLSECI